MRSPAASITALCADGIRAVDEGRTDDLEEVMGHLAEIGRPEDAGTAAEIEAALAATKGLHRAVERAARRTAMEIAHVQQGRRALEEYEGTPGAKGPRAVDLSA